MCGISGWIFSCKTHSSVAIYLCKNPTFDKPFPKNISHHPIRWLFISCTLLPVFTKLSSVFTEQGSFLSKQSSKYLGSQDITKMDEISVINVNNSGKNETIKNKYTSTCNLPT